MIKVVLRGGQHNICISGYICCQRLKDILVNCENLITKLSLLAQSIFDLK